MAVTKLPRNLDKQDRIRALEILGLGSAAKILDNPYPLGGYSGFEMGLAAEFIPVDELAGLGSGTTDNGELNYYTLTFGKGVYHNVDTMVYFSPITGDEEVGNFGGQLRWGFYEARFFPISFSTIVYGGGTSFSNLINVTTVGIDLIATVNVENVALYLGGGTIRAIGQFIGGADGITDNGQTIQEDISEEHLVFGLNVNFSKMFVALEVDRYVDSVYSGKLGFRF
ncbi:hypothetical protein D3C87_176150 [compost metagenome]